MEANLSVLQVININLLKEDNPKKLLNHSTLYTLSVKTKRFPKNLQFYLGHWIFIMLWMSNSKFMGFIVGLGKQVY